MLCESVLAGGGQGKVGTLFFFSSLSLLPTRPRWAFCERLHKSASVTSRWSVAAAAAPTRRITLSRHSRPCVGGRGERRRGLASRLCCVPLRAGARFYFPSEGSGCCNQTAGGRHGGTEGTAEGLTGGAADVDPQSQAAVAVVVGGRG